MLSRLPEAFRSILASWIVDELNDRPPSNVRALRMVLEIVTGAEASFANQLRKMSADRFQRIRRRDLRLHWLSILTCTDAEAGLSALEKLLAAHKDQMQRDNVIVDLLSIMFSHTHRD